MAPPCTLGTRAVWVTGGGGYVSPMAATKQQNLDDSKFAFPDERKEPIHDAAHVRNAVARFDQVEDVTDAEREKAWKRIQAAAKRFDVEIEADDWRDLAHGGKPKKH